MAKFRFQADVVFEASDEESACRSLASRLADIARHVGGGETMEANEPFFALAIVDTVDESPDPMRDPIVEERTASELSASVSDSALEQEPAKE